VPEPVCGGSFVELDREGARDDPTRPKEIVCPICGIKMMPDYEEYELNEKKGVFFVSVPMHYPGEARSG
jgi:hypothetical protein